MMFAVFTVETQREAAGQGMVVVEERIAINPDHVYCLWPCDENNKCLLKGPDVVVKGSLQEVKDILDEALSENLVE